MCPIGSRSGSLANRSRREILRYAALAGGALAFGIGGSPVFAATPPKEAGLSFEGLLKDEPGFQPRKPAPLPLAEITGFLSRQQLDRNYAVYRAAFASLLAARDALATAPRDAAHANQYAALRRQQMTAANAVLLHEFYFRNLAAAPVKPSRYVLANMTEHMGTMESWREDFAACARVANSWGALVYDPYDDRWHNVALGDADAGGWVGSNPLVVCDVAAHAWSMDYKEIETYIGRFLDHIDWNAVAARYRAADRH
ncbi:MAG: Fe-Mn family superoxide dismutase [Candidatus Binataceae bacterium]